MPEAAIEIHRTDPSYRGALRQRAESIVGLCVSRLAQLDHSRQMAVLDAMAASCTVTLGVFAATAIEKVLIRSEENRFWIVLLSAVAAGAAFVLLRRHIRTLAGCPYLGRGFAQDLSPVGQAILTAPDIDGMLQCAAEHMQTVLRCRSVAIFQRSPQDYSYRLAAQIGLPEGMEATFERDSVLADHVRTVAAPPFSQLPTCESMKLRATGGVLIAPIRRGRELTGFINLGRKLPGGGYSGREIGLLAAMAEQLALAVGNLRLAGHELEGECARDIQLALLPREVPQLPGYEIATAWQPARTVSGDYFDVLQLNANKLGICIGDVAGKGVPAALLMCNIQVAVRAFAAADVTPAELCGKVNRVVSSNIAAGKFITFFYGVLDSIEHSLSYTNAGHNPPLVIREDGSAMRLEGGGPVLGVFPQASYTQAGVSLSCGDRLILFTDGLTEAGNRTGEEFGEDRLEVVATENRHAGARALRSAIMQALRAFAPGELEDDVTLVVATARTRDSCVKCRRAAAIQPAPPLVRQNMHLVRELQ